MRYHNRVGRKEVGKDGSCQQATLYFYHQPGVYEPVKRKSHPKSQRQNQKPHAPMAIRKKEPSAEELLLEDEYYLRKSEGRRGGFSKNKNRAATQALLLNNIGRMIEEFGQEFVEHVWGTVEPGNHSLAKRWIYRHEKPDAEWIIGNFDEIWELSGRVMKNERERVKKEPRYDPADEDHYGGEAPIDHVAADAGAARKCAKKLDYLIAIRKLVFEGDIEGAAKYCEGLKDEKPKAARELHESSDLRYLITLATPIKLDLP